MSRNSDTRSVSLRKVTFQIDEALNGDASSAGAVEPSKSLRQAKVLRVVLAFLALLAVWVMYGIPTVVLGLQRMQVSSIFSQSRLHPQVKLASQ